MGQTGVFCLWHPFFNQYTVPCSTTNTHMNTYSQDYTICCQILHTSGQKQSKNTFNARNPLKDSGDWADGIHCPAIITPQQDVCVCVCVLVWRQVVWVRILSLISPKHDGFQALSLYHYYNSLRPAAFLLPLAGECASLAFTLGIQQAAEITAHLVTSHLYSLHLLKCQKQIRCKFEINDWTQWTIKHVKVQRFK